MLLVTYRTAQSLGHNLVPALCVLRRLKKRIHGKLKSLHMTQALSGPGDDLLICKSWFFPDNSFVLT